MPWTGYKKRLQTIRAELADIEADCTPIATSDKPDEVGPVVAVASAVARIARILIRVIDSLPG